MNFQEFLKSKGFKPYSYEIVNRNTIETECKNENFFSTMSPLCVIYKRDDIVITYGLNEYNHPPTIIYPTPNVIDESTGFNYLRLSDSIVSLCALYDRALQKYTNEQVYDSMINKTLLLV